MTPAYFERLGENLFRPTVHAGGAWQPDVELHVGPVTGLLLHEVERFLAARGSSLLVSRLSFDVLGRLDATELTVGVEVVRPGRAIELIEATASIGGRVAVRVRIWLVAGNDTAAVAGGEPESLPPPDTLPRWSPTTVWGGSYMATLDGRRTATTRPGRGAAWLRTDAAVVDGEVSTPLTRWVTLVDTANGIAVREAPDAWSFPSIDLTIHLYRQPSGPWVGLDVSVVFGAGGQGLTSAVLHDVDGPVGRAAQILALRRR